MSEPDQITLDALAEEFSEQCASGEGPSVEELAVRYPEFSEDIRELFPTLKLISKVLPEGDDETEFPAARNQLEDQTIGDFRLIRELGRGGMGIVYEAEQLSLKRRVALKLLPSAHQFDSNQKARFEREAKAAGRLHHTNIVPVFGIDTSDSIAYLVMQLIPGMSLDKLIRRLRQAQRLDTMFTHTEVANPAARDDIESAGTGSVAKGLAANGTVQAEPLQQNVSIGDEYWRNLGSLGQQVAEALQYAFDQGILHRDIKPGNLILDLDNRVWVTDFGLAKIIDSDELTNTGDVLGTVKYMAPERLKGEYSGRSDIYSLGATLYELAALRPAFSPQQQGSLGRKLLREPPPSLRKLRPSMPQDLVTIIEKAMAIEPERRYPTAGEFAADLTRFLNDEPIKARSIGFVEHTVRWARRNPMIATLVTALAACLLAAAVVSTQAAQHFRHLNSELAETNGDLERANLTATTEQNLSQQRETRLLFQRGQEFAEQGKIAEGLLLMAEALHQCPDEMQDYARVIRASVSAWSALVPDILEMNPNPFERYRAIDYCENGSSGDFFVLADDKVLLVDAESGEQIGAAFELDSFAFDCAISPQGHKVAVTTRESQNELLVLDLKDMSQSQVRLNVDPSLVLQHPYWHPNGHSVAVRTRDNGHFVVWKDFHSPDYTSYPVNDQMEAETRSLLREFMPDNDASLIRSFLKNSSLRDGRLEIADLHASMLIKEVETGNYLRLSMPHAADIVTTADGEQIQSNHFRLRNFKSRSRFPPNASASLTEYAPSKYWNESTAAFSQDGERAIIRDPHILFWGEPERKVPRTAAQLLDTRTGQPIGKPLQHPFDSVRAVAMSPDGAIAATGGYQFGESSGAVYLWDAGTGQKVFGPLTHENYVCSLGFSPDGKRLAAGDYDGQVRIWDIATGEQIGQTIEAGKIVYALRFDLSGQRIALGLFGEVLSKDNCMVWDFATSQSTTFPHPASATELIWIPGTDRLISGNVNSVRLWDVHQPQNPIAFLDDIGEVFGTSVSESGDLIAFGTSSGSVILMDSTTGRVLPNVLSHRSTIYDVDLSPDGKTLAAACNDGGLRIWDLTTFEQIGPPLMQNGPLYRTRFLTRDSSVLSTARDGTTRIWKVPQGTDVEVEQVRRLIEIRTCKRFVNGVAMKIPADEWASLREQAIKEKLMLSQADSAAISESMPDLVQVIPQRELHEARARDAEQDGDWFGAHWHFDQLLPKDQSNAKQSEWRLYARRARTWTQRAEYERAGNDYESASSLLEGDLEPLINWYRHRVVACQRAEKWKTAVWYLDRILLHDKDDLEASTSRAEAHLKVGKGVKSTEAEQTED